MIRREIEDLLNTKIKNKGTGSCKGLEGET